MSSPEMDPVRVLRSDQGFGVVSISLHIISLRHLLHLFIQIIMLLGYRKIFTTAGPIKSQTIGIKNWSLQRKLTLSEEYFHHGRAGFA